MFFAGLKDVEHKPHSFYIDRYPVGREATVAWGAVDLRFENDTPYGVLVEARVTPATSSSQGVVTVSMWSTKYWDITSRTGERFNLTKPATRTLTTEDCYPNTGYGGFDINVWRYFRRPGSESLVRTEKFFTRYIPSDTVICKKPPPAADAEASQTGRRDSPRGQPVQGRYAAYASGSSPRARSASGPTIVCRVSHRFRGGRERAGRSRRAVGDAQRAR